MVDFNCKSKLMRSSSMVAEMNFSSINFDSCWNLFLSLTVESDLMHCPWCIGVYRTGIYCSEQKIWKIYKRSLKYEIVGEEFNNTSWSIFSKDFAHKTMTASFLILEGFIWMQLIYFLTIIAFCFLKCLCRYMGSL